MGGARSFWGWGLEGGGPSAEQQRGILATVAKRFAGHDTTLAKPPRIQDVQLPAPRAKAPDSLAEICSSTPLERASHTYGKSYRDIVRGARGVFEHPPDFVARPRDEAEVAAVLDWCGGANVACIPYGGGSSVVAGVEAAVGDAYAGAVSLDLGRLDRVLEIDRSSRAARIQAGIFGPALEDHLRPHGLTLRHFPQSFEFSTLGGWLATRSGGHYATLYTHIEDFLQSMRVVTPSGVVESRRLPGSGAGPSPDRLFCGSEGTLGVITEAWMRLQDRPSFRVSAAVRFEGQDGFARGAEAVRALSQAGLFPANCRLLDPQEAHTSAAGDGTHAVLVLGFESADHSPAARMARALECCADAGGVVPEDAGATQEDAPQPGSAAAPNPSSSAALNPSSSAAPNPGSAAAPNPSSSAAPNRQGAAGAWRKAFLNAPYVRDVLVRAAVVCETFETAITWDRFPEFHAGVMSATRDAVERVCGAGTVACRFTHVYPDGAAPYYSVLAPGRRGSELEQWAEIKAAAAEAIIAAGGTITHHHAVGRDHRPGYDQQRPELFARALHAAKRELDPHGILNPGVLIDAPHS